MNQRAMTPAERKRKQRERQSEDIAVKPAHEWTEAECLMVLSGTAWARGSPMDKGAWEQLGRLRGFIS